MENKMSKEVTTMEPQNAETTFLPATTKVSDIVPINIEKALAAMSEEERQQIIALADAIDISKMENILNYGSEPLRNTFNRTGEFLKAQKGTQADQEVMKMVVELSNKAKSAYDDFELSFQEPNWLEKLLLSLSAKKRSEKAAKLPSKALNSYSLLMALKKQSANWLEILKEGMGTISYSMYTDAEDESLIEKYLIAGVIAAPRLEGQIAEVQQQANETGLSQDARQLMLLTEGYDKFIIKMKNLADSRVMYKLSQAQLGMMQNSNYDVQCSIHTQTDNAMAAMSMQLRNAVLNQQIQDVMVGQKAVIRLNDALVQEVAKEIGVTGQQAREMLYAGAYNVDAAITAINTVMDACNQIKSTNNDLYPQMVENARKLNELVEKLAPYLDENTMQHPIEMTTTTMKPAQKLTGKSELTF